MYFSLSYQGNPQDCEEILSKKIFWFVLVSLVLPLALIAVVMPATYLSDNSIEFIATDFLHCFPHLKVKQKEIDMDLPRFMMFYLPLYISIFCNIILIFKCRIIISKNAQSDEEKNFGK